MKLLFTLDSKNYDESIEIVKRPSARGIIISGGKVLMIHSKKYDYYKFPGGGIDKGETACEALIREVREEAGLKVISDTIRDFGNVHRRSVTEKGGLFVQDNYYFLCECEKDECEQRLDAYEAEEGFTPEAIDPILAIKKNLECSAKRKNPNMLKREAMILEILIKEGYFS